MCILMNKTSVFSLMLLWPSHLADVLNRYIKIFLKGNSDRNLGVKGTEKSFCSFHRDILEMQGILSVMVSANYQQNA